MQVGRMSFNLHKLAYNIFSFSFKAGIPHVLNELGIGSELGPQSIYGLFEGTDFPNQYG